MQDDNFLMMIVSLYVTIICALIIYVASHVVKQAGSTDCRILD